MRLFLFFFLWRYLMSEQNYVVHQKKYENRWYGGTIPPIGFKVDENGRSIVNNILVSTLYVQCVKWIHLSKIMDPWLTFHFHLIVLRRFLRWLPLNLILLVKALDGVFLVKHGTVTTSTLLLLQLTEGNTKSSSMMLM